MATSRYGDPATDAALSGKQDSTTNTSTTTPATTTETSGTSSTTKNMNTVTNTQNMTPSSLAALNALIAQLMAGGTANMKQDRAVKNGEIAGLQQQRAGYSKEAAFADAKGLMAQQMRMTLEKLMPSINAASLGAGASSSSMRALLTQRASENAAENASAAGLGAAVNYGQVSNGMSSVLANLLGQQDPVAAALINALSVAKGAVTNSKTNGTETSNTASSQTQQNSGGTTTAAQTVNYGSPMTSNNQMSLPSMTPVAYGPLATDESIALNNLKYIGTTQDTLNQLLKGSSFETQYTF